ncbi:MAG: PspC domain-containing protein [Bryobacterales bacterium]|nr:PspC domain-containing protein [Bryobacterales bacterium]
MYCTRCGLQLEDSDLYCARCGQPTRPDLTPPLAQPRRLTRAVREKKIGGVCAGFARYLGMDVTLMRILWLALLFVSGGIAGLVYLGAWIVMPREDEPAAA